MTRKPVQISDLEEARANLVSSFSELMTDQDKQFLLSVKLGKPEWNLFPISGIDQLPSVRWKLLNIERMSDVRRNTSLVELERVLCDI